MIFTERTITIRNDSSSINAPVVLYRGDKNVEVRFTLVESPYKYSNRDSINIIESTNASYAQLVIKTPNDRDPIFGDITAVGQSNVVFIIGYDMIDEIEEVGTYSFQIRLFDADQTSMVTIPEVVGGFIIREPIAKEDTNNNITNSAIVGSAVVTNDLEIPTFVGGSYNKSAWYDGVVISRQKLDKIEDGIYETYELSKVNNSQIKKKASKQELDVQEKRIDSFTSLSEGSTTGDAELMDARIATTGDVYSNVGGAIRGQLDCLKLIKSGNLFDAKNILKNTRLVTWNSPNKIDQVYSKEGSYTSPIIKVEAGKRYCFILNGSIYNLPNCISEMTYDENGNHVRDITPENHIYTIDNRECYIRFTINSPFNKYLCFKEYTKDMNLEYEQYGETDSNRIKTLENNVNNLNDNVKILTKRQLDNICIKSILNKDHLNRQISSIGDYICSLSDSIAINNEQFLSKDSNIKKYSDETAKICIPIGSQQNTSIKISKDINVSFDEGDVMCIFFYVDWNSVDSDTKTVSSPIYSIRFYYTNNDGVEVEKRLNYYEIIRGWQMVKIPFSKATTVSNIKCYVQANVNEILNDVIVNFDSVFKNYRMKPCILLNFDNMMDSNMYGVVYPLLESFGFKGTFYLSGKSALGGNYISKSHFDEMIDNGWDYAFYGASGSTHGYNSDYETAYNSVKEIIDYRRETDGIPLPISWFCQNGQTSNTFSKVLKDLGFKIVRCTGLPCINYFGEDSLETKFNSLDATTTSNRLEEVKSLVDKTINEGNALSIFTHQLYETPDDTGINSTVEVWTEFLTYLKSKVDAGLIEVLTYKEFYERCVRTSLVEKQFNLRNMYRIQKLENK